MCAVVGSRVRELAKALYSLVFVIYKISENLVINPNAVHSQPYTWQYERNTYKLCPYTLFTSMPYNFRYK
jgi:hypothetical protein